MRKYLSILVIFILLVGVTFTIKNSVNNNTILDNVILKDSSSNSSMFAIMVENDSGEYEEYTDSDSWPIGMTFNDELSGCVDNNGNTVDGILSFKGTKATVNTSRTVYCYLYFDQYEYGDLAKAILLAENDSSTVSEAINYIVSKGTPDFSTTSTTDEGLYAAEDDYGTSYYFRGSVEDNYVYFAGFYWRIVRINGDGSVRLIYDGTEKHKNGETDADRYISNSDYYITNSDPIYINYFYRNAYVGYMHGDTKYEEYHATTTSSLSQYMSGNGFSYYVASTYSFDETTGLYTLGSDASSVSSLVGTEEKYFMLNNTTNSAVYLIDSVSSSTQATAYKYSQTPITTSYEDEHANINDSVVKTVVDSFYEDYLSSYSDYLSDTLFCNDRSLSSTTTGTGMGNSSTKYAARDRLKYYTDSSNYTISFDNSPVLTCAQQNDAFTVSDTTYGNGALTYPIALITADEVVMAGGIFILYYQSYYNYPDVTKYYLYIGSSYWTMTPDNLSGIPAIMYDTAKGLQGYITYYSGTYAVRPVINLSSSVTVTSGDGTYDSPYEVALS